MGVVALTVLMAGLLDRNSLHHAVM